MSTATYTVTGMTCGHCVSSVTEEVSAIAGVTDVEVDLPSGAVTVTSDEAIPADAVHEAIPADAVREAVNEAGYEVSNS